MISMPSDSGHSRAQPVTVLGPHAVALRRSSRDLSHDLLRPTNPEQRKTFPGPKPGSRPRGPAQSRRSPRFLPSRLRSPVTVRSAPLRSAEIELLEEIVAFVIDDDEGRKILDLDPPDRLHAELGIFQHLDLADAVLGEIRRRPADRAEIEAT